MKVAFYTIDDVRLGHDPAGINGWRLCQFLRLDDAAEHYSHLASAAVKELGLTNGIQVLPLIRCLSLTPYAYAGEDVLIGDGLALPLWKGVPQVLDAARELVSRLDVRFCLIRDQIFPAPPAKAAVPSRPAGRKAPKGEILGSYVEGMGWLTPEELARRYPHSARFYRFPLVLKYRVKTEGGVREVSPWAYNLTEQVPALS